MKQVFCCLFSRYFTFMMLPETRALANLAAYFSLLWLLLKRYNTGTPEICSSSSSSVKSHLLIPPCNSHTARPEKAPCGQVVLILLLQKPPWCIFAHHSSSLIIDGQGSLSVVIILCHMLGKSPRGGRQRHLYHTGKLRSGVYF